MMQVQRTVGSDWSVLEVIRSCHRDPQGCSGFCPSQVLFFGFVLDAENLPLQLRKAVSRNTKLKRIGILVPTPKMNNSSKCYTILLTAHGFGLRNCWWIAAVVGLDSMPRYAFWHLFWFLMLILLFPESAQVIDSFYSPSPRICFTGGGPQS